MEVDLVVLANLMLCVTIVLMGLIGYSKSKHTLPLSLATVFGLFGVSHALLLFGLTEEFGAVVFAIRVAAYALVIYMLYRYIQILDVF